jgi:hypothetical protein
LARAFSAGAPSTCPWTPAGYKSIEKKIIKMCSLQSNMKPIFLPHPLTDWTEVSIHAEVIYLESHLDKLDWEELSRNPNAIPLLEQNMDKIDLLWILHNPSICPFLKKNGVHVQEQINWNALSRTPQAIPFLTEHLDKVNWYYLCQMPDAISLIEQHPDKIDWEGLSSNSAAMDLLTQNQDKIHWHRLCQNENPRIIPLLESRVTAERPSWSTFDKIDWYALSANPIALPLLEKYPGKIHWNNASRNPALLPLFEKNLHHVMWHYLCIYIKDMSFLEKHMDKLNAECWSELSKRAVAVPLLEKYPEYIDWIRLCWNPGAIHLLEQNPEKIDLVQLSSNPNAIHLLFRLDHVQMRERNEAFKEELEAYVFEPCRLIRLSGHFGIDFRNYLQVY